MRTVLHVVRTSAVLGMLGLFISLTTTATAAQAGADEVEWPVVQPAPGVQNVEWP